MDFEVDIQDTNVDGRDTEVDDLLNDELSLLEALAIYESDPRDKILKLSCRGTGEDHYKRHLEDGVMIYEYEYKVGI